MTLHGHIHNGEIVLTDRVLLPEGAAVEVVVVPASPQPASTPLDAPADGARPLSFAERYKDFIGCIDGLPEDLSVNLDHYLYGTPKRQ